jgi:hypothetical protein
MLLNSLDVAGQESTHLASERVQVCLQVAQVPGEQQVVPNLIQRALSHGQKANLVGLSSSAASFGNICSDRYRRPSHLLSQGEQFRFRVRVSGTINGQHEQMRLLPADNVLKPGNIIPAAHSKHKSLNKTETLRFFAVSCKLPAAS